MEAFRSSFQRLKDYAATPAEETAGLSVEGETEVMPPLEEKMEAPQDNPPIKPKKKKRKKKKAKSVPAVSTNPFDGPATPEPPHYQSNKGGAKEIIILDAHQTPPGQQATGALPTESSPSTTSTNITDPLTPESNPELSDPKVTESTVFRTLFTNATNEWLKVSNKIARDPDEVISAQGVNDQQKGQDPGGPRALQPQRSQPNQADPPIHGKKPEDPPEESDVNESSTPSLTVEASESSVDPHATEAAQPVTNVWETYKSLALTSPTGFPMDEMDSVFIQDDSYVWVPAKVLEYHPDCALVAIDPPENWEETTTLVPGNDKALHPSMAEVAAEDIERLVMIYGIPQAQLRKVSYYEGDLLAQNGELGKRDMADLTELHPAAILYNLKDRHANGKPYTRVGDIVIAMNPFAWMKDLYEPSLRDMYSTKLIWEPQEEDEGVASELTPTKALYDRLGFDPHVYEVSALAYKGLATTGKDQTIVVTGESGAGKTETVKIVMNHLATVQQTRPGGVPTEHSPAKDIVSRVLQSSPVFEAFGNAKTLRNHNSSRFGKFIQLQFQVEPKHVAEVAGRDVPFTDLVGSKCTTYLLEKNRVVHQDLGERNFHVFYQLLAAPEKFKKTLWPALGTKTARDFCYTAGEIGDAAIDGEAWEDTMMSLKLFRFNGESLETLLQALIVVLQLGNLVFDQDISESGEDTTTIRSMESMNELSELMGIPVAELEQSLTSRLLRTRGQDDIRVALTPQVAKESCDALAKEIFARIFDVLVHKINNYTGYPETLKNEEGNFGQICLLDIFGFERFDTNRFEQLCINYANERLHNKYVVDNFNEVKGDYDAEGVDLYDFKLVDNSETIDLLEGKAGILVSLNEECMLPNGRSEAFVFKTKAYHKNSKSMIDKKLQKKFEFGINHFNGSVYYDAQDFVVRNMDKLPDTLLECVAKSTNPLIRTELKKLTAPLEDDASISSGSSHKRKSAGSRTVLHKFQSQLKKLMAEMEGTKTRYIRCIKPNTDMIARKTEHGSTMQQLSCSGIMTALTIARESFPNKLQYEFILDRYSCLLNDRESSDSSLTSIKDQVEHMLSQKLKVMAKKSRNGSGRMPFACGKTKVFFKAGAQDKLEELRMEYFTAGAVKIQSWTRCRLAMYELKRAKASIRTQQSFARMFIVRKKFLQKRHGATVLSSWFRARKALALLGILRKERAALKIQAQLRALPARRSFNANKNAARVLQRASRSFQTRVAVRRRIEEKPRLDTQNTPIGLKATTSEVTPSQLALSKQHAYTNEKMVDVAAEIGSMNAEKERELAAAKNDEMVYKLQLQLASTTALNEELKAKLEVSEIEHREMTLTADSKNSAISTYRSRTQDLVKANEGLVKEVKQARQEATKAKRKLHSSNENFSSKLSDLEEEMERMTKSYESDILQLREALKESQQQREEEQKAFKQTAMINKEKFELQKKQIKEELRIIQKTSRKKLTKLMEVLETTHGLREAETAKLESEVSLVKREKDEEIRRLEQEVRALRVLKEGSMKDVRGAIDPGTLRSQLAEEEASRSLRAAQFEDAIKKFQVLVNESSALPVDITDQNMQSVVEQQDRGEKMNDLLEVLSHLFRMEEDSQNKTNQTALDLVDEYVTLTEPNRTITELRSYMAEIELANQELRQELMAYMGDVTREPEEIVSAEDAFAHYEKQPPRHRPRDPQEGSFHDLYAKRVIPMDASGEWDPPVSTEERKMIKDPPVDSDTASAMSPTLSNAWENYRSLALHSPTGSTTLDELGSILTEDVSLYESSVGAWNSTWSPLPNSLSYESDL